MEQTPPTDVVTALNSSATGQHLLLGSLVLPKNADDPTTVTEGIEDGLTKFWIEDGRLYVGVYSTDLGTWTVLGEEPVGTIKPYAGLESNIPRGWYLCDGNNGTHDLRGYFILGSSLDDAGVATDATSAVLADHAALADHVVTQPSAHSSNDSTVNIADTGSGTIVMTSFTLTNNHAGAAVDSHTAIDAHSFTSEPTPASFTLAFIEKVSS